MKQTQGQRNASIKTKKTKKQSQTFLALPLLSVDEGKKDCNISTYHVDNKED